MLFEFREFFLNSKIWKILGIQPIYKIFSLMFDKKKHQCIKNRTQSWFTDLSPSRHWWLRPIIRLIQIFFTWETVVFNVGLLKINIAVIEKQGYFRSSLSFQCTTVIKFCSKMNLANLFITTSFYWHVQRNLSSQKSTFSCEICLIVRKKCFTFLWGSISFRKIVLIEIFFQIKTSDPVYLIIMMPI